MFCRERLRVQIKKDISGLPPRILLETHSFWMGKINHQKLLHLLARPISGPGSQTPHEKKSTILGHLQQPREGLRSTQEKVMHSEPDPEHDQLPQATQSENTNLVFFNTVDLSGKIYMDQTGRFPVTSSKGNKYILVAYHCDSNTIRAEPLKTRSGLDLKSEYQKMHSLLNNRGLIPHLHILDNECPNVLKTFMREVNEQFQLVPTHIHRRNSSEQAIRTFKKHFIAGLSSTHKEFPLHIWSRLIPHVIITLNLVQQYCMNPKLSGYAQLHG